MGISTVVLQNTSSGTITSGIYSKYWTSVYCRDTYIVCGLLAKPWKQPKCPTKDGWIKTPWCTQWIFIDS